MKKLMMAAAALCFVSPAFAADAPSDADMKKMAEHCLKKADTDANGTVSADESAAYGKVMFTEADANADGQLSLDEMVAHHKKMMEEVMGSSAAPAEAAPADAGH